MIFFRRNKEMIHFSGRRNSKLGILSFLIGIAVVIGFITLSILSGLAGGKGSLLLGFIGILLLGLSICGFVLSYKSFKKKDIFYRYPIIGAILNGLMTIIFLLMYIVGIAL